MKRFIFSMILLLSGLTLSAAEEPAKLETPTGTLYGTLAVPQEPSHTVALIIAGSGPTDRNGNSAAGLNTDCYRILADTLAAHGYASLRYDKRAIGESASACESEEQLTFDTYIDDAVAWADKLVADERFDRVVLIGHSEGALIALVAAQRSDAVCGVISLAGAGEPIDAVLMRQISAQSQEAAEACRPIVEKLKAGERVDEIPFYLQSLFRPSVQPFLISNMKYDPAQEASKLGKPLMIIQGTTDMQVTVDDARKLAAAAPKADLKIIERMNHVLKCCDTMSQQAQMFVYVNPTIALAPGLTEAIIEFFDKVD